jgi:hypothetical protein
MAQEQIILHKDQTTIFDFTEDTTEPSVPDIDTSSIQIKTKPPYHKDLFPNVVLVQLSKTNYLALIAKDHNAYTTEFYYKKKDGIIFCFKPATQLKLFQLIKDNINSKSFINEKHFMMEDYSSLFHIDDDFKKSDAEIAFIENDFDKIFKILASIK